MDWFMALNFLVRGRPWAVRTLSDHFVRISSRSDWILRIRRMACGGYGWFVDSRDSRRLGRDVSTNFRFKLGRGIWSL